jgi:hypothetical protein
MGQAVWLYLWCLKHQTRRNGLVLGGSPLTHTRINIQLGQSLRTLKRWLKVLRLRGYIEVTYLDHKRLRIRILKSKKFGFKQLPLAMEQPSDRNGPLTASQVPNMAHSQVPNMAHTRDKNGTSKQSGTLSSNETSREEVPSVLVLETQKGLPLDRTSEKQPPFSHQKQNQESEAERLDRMEKSGRFSAEEMQTLRKACERNNKIRKGLELEWTN